MKINNIITSGAVAIFGLFLITSCDDDEMVKVEEDLSSETIDLVQENTYLETVEEEIDAGINEAIEYAYEKSSVIRSKTDEPECATITVEPDSTYPKTLLIDFGSGCEGVSGLTRSGSITIVITDSLQNPGASYTATFNMTVEGFSLKGTKSTTNTGTSEVPVFEEEISLKTTTPAGTVIEKNKTMTREQIEGTDTPEQADNVFLLTGSAEVHSSTGSVYSYEITQPLKVSRTCEIVVEGVMEINWSGQTEPVTINFGEGICDRKIYVSRARRIVKRVVYLNSLID